MTSTSTSPSAAPAVGGVQTVRRVITYILLIIMVTIAAFGLSELLYRFFASGSDTAYFDNYGLAMALASALIAGPLAALLWWLTWRTSANERDRASIAWPVYLVITSTSALLTFTIALFGWIADAIAGYSAHYALALGIVWAAIWLWHYWMWRHPSKGPTRMVGVAPALASLIGLTFGVGGLIFAIAKLIDSSTAVLGSVVVGGGSVWQAVAQSLVWAVGGGLVWAWHWFGVGVRTQTTGFAHVLLVYIAGGASFALVAYGITHTLAVILQLLTGTPGRLNEILGPLGIALGCALIGALVLVYHSRVVGARGPEVRAATRLVSAGVSLVFVATGVGVTVNALLATVSDPVVGNSIRALLLSGISALLVGGTLWWVTWRPLSAAAPERAATPGRRAYLVVIFGVSALVALITLLVIGFQLFTLMLDGDGGGGFLTHSRQAIGLLAATVLVAVYHFTIWTKDRASGSTMEHIRRIERVTLVTSSVSDEHVTALHASTGARVNVLQRADAVDGEPDAAQLVAALDGIEAGHVLVVAGANGKVEVVRLAD